MRPTKVPWKRALALIPLAMLLSASDCGSSLEPDPAEPYLYIEREDDNCQYRQYYRKQGNENVRVITYKRFKGPGHPWFAPGSKDLADRVFAIDGFADAQSSTNTGPPPGPSAEVSLDPRLYLLDEENRIHVIAPERATPEVATVTLPAESRGIARARPNGSLFVVHRGTPDDDPFLPPAPARISVFDVETLRVSRVMDLEGEALVNYTAAPLAVSPDERLVLVANAGSKVVDGRVVTASSVEAYDAQTGALLKNIPMPSDPLSAGNTVQVNNVFFSPDGSTAWASREGGGYLVVIDVRTMTVSTSLRTLGGFNDLAFSPDGTRAYILGVRAVSVRSTATLEEIATIPLEDANRPVRLSLTPDGLELFARDDLAGLVWTIDTKCLEVIEKLEENPGFTSVMAFVL